MAINVGVLELLIATPGADAAIRNVERLDTTAAATSTRAGGALSGLASVARTAMAGLATAIASVGIAETFSAAVEASTRLAVSMRVLDSTARLTGVPLAFLQRTSDGLQRSLGLTATNANTMVATAVRFTAAAGRANETGSFMTRWLDLAASRGLSASEAMSALETTLAGNDEGLNRIGLRNPGEIFKSWGAGADTASRFGAILNEVMSVGNAVAGSYAAGMQTAQGAVERLTNAKETFLVTLGQAITGGEGYSGVLGSLTSTVQMMTSAVTANAGAIRDFVRDLASIAAAGAGALAFLGRIGATLNVVNAQMQVASAYARVGLMFGQGDSRANLDRALAGLRSADAAFANPTASPRGEDPLAEQNELRDLRALQGAPATATPTTLGGARARPRSTAGGDTASPFAPLLAGGPAGIANTMTGGALGVRPLLGTVPATIRVAPKIEAPGFVAEMQRFYQNAGRIISGGMAQGLAASIQNGVRAAFEGRGVTGVIRAFGATMLSAVGGIFVELGETYLMYGGIMQGLAALLPNPFTAGPAGLAIGAALIALGTALNGVASGRGRGGGGGGSFSAPGVGGDVFRGIVLNPRAAPVGGQFAPTGRSGMPATARPVVNNFTVIGQNDPTAQRQIANMVATATRRGIT